MPTTFRGARTFAAILLFALAQPATAQTNYSWNFSGTDWNTAASWSPGGVPGTSDKALLGPFDAPVYNLPSFSGSASVGQFQIIGPRPLADALITGNANTLSLGSGGAMSAAALSYRGTFVSTVILDNLRVNIANGTAFPSSGFPQTLGAVELSGLGARFELRNGSQLRMVDAAGTTNYDLTINGAQVLVRAGAQLTNGIGVNSSAQGAIRFHGGGILNVQGANGAASTFDLNQISAVSGHASVGVFIGSTTGGTPSVRLNTGNGALQRGIDRYTRNSAGTVIGLGSGTIEFNFNDEIPGFTGAQGQLFFANGAVGATVPSQNGVITEGTSLNTNSPYVILTGSIPSRSGSLGRFATYDSGTGAITAQTGTAKNDTDLATTTANSNIVYRPSSTSSSANATLTNNISPQTVVFEPQAGGQSVNLNGFALTTSAIIVERSVTGNAAFTFDIDGGIIAGPGASLRNIFVLGGSTSTFFRVSSLFGSQFGGGGGVVKSGNGTMVLTANSDQFNWNGDIIINQGAIRARTDGANVNLGPNNVLALRGGVLEIDAGNGTSTFSRSLGKGLGQVNWSHDTNFGDRGSGGFAVVNGSLNVNIGGAGATLVWNGATGGNQFFVRAGQSLRLGDANNNGIITFQNGIALDDGSAGLPFDSRAIIVDARSNISLGQLPDDAAVRSRITGVISGSAATRLVKGGPALLELTAANTYAGGTSVDFGTLQVNNTSGSATGTGPVLVSRGILFGNGAIAPAAGNGVTIGAGGFSTGGILIADRERGTPGNVKIGTAGLNNPFTVQPGGVIGFRLNGETFDPNGGNTSYGRITISGTGAVTLANGSLTVGLDNGFTPNSSSGFGLIDNQTANVLTGTLNYWDTSANPSNPPAVAIPEGGMVIAVNADNSLAGTFHVTYFGNITATGVFIEGGNDLVVYGFTPVPEPASILAVGAVALAGLGLRRRVLSKVAARA